MNSSILNRKLLQLGGGRFGLVFLCQASDNQYVAAKVAKTSNARATICHEYYLLKHINDILKDKPDRAIVRVLDCFEEGDLFVFTMQAMQEDSLATVIHDQGCLDVTTSQRYISQLASAMSFLAFVNVIHRDIKANNILLSQSGGVKLADFDQSILISSTEINLSSYIHISTQRKASTITGVPHAMSPEMVHGGLGYDCKSDWWALGILAYEMITGQTPSFYRGNGRETMWPSMDDQQLLHNALDQEGNYVNNDDYIGDKMRRSWDFSALNELNEELCDLERRSDNEDTGGDLEALMKNYRIKNRRQLLPLANDFITKLLIVSPKSRMGFHNADDYKNNNGELQHDFLLCMR